MTALWIASIAGNTTGAYSSHHHDQLQGAALHWDQVLFLQVFGGHALDGRNCLPGGLAATDDARRICCRIRRTAKVSLPNDAPTGACPYVACFVKVQVRTFLLADLDLTGASYSPGFLNCAAGLHSQFDAPFSLPYLCRLYPLVLGRRRIVTALVSLGVRCEGETPGEERRARVCVRTRTCTRRVTCEPPLHDMTRETEARC